MPQTPLPLFTWWGKPQWQPKVSGTEQRVNAPQRPRSEKEKVIPWVYFCLYFNFRAARKWNRLRAAMETAALVPSTAYSHLQGNNCWPVRLKPSGVVLGCERLAKGKPHGT